jgi:hypothetical protein
MQRLGWRVCAALVGVGVGLGLGMVACYELPPHPVFGYEVDDISCTDYVDNDHDGLVDCADPDCLILANLCGEDVPLNPVEEPEDTLQKCTDKIDNDQDGQFDCGDPECREIPETCCLREFDDATCSDKIDNDGNGFADCDDFGCSRGKFVSVCTEDSNASCDDELDNDDDGKIDCDDEDCETTNVCVSQGPPPDPGARRTCRRDSGRCRRRSSEAIGVRRRSSGWDCASRRATSRRRLPRWTASRPATRTRGRTAPRR